MPKTYSLLLRLGGWLLLLAVAGCNPSEPEDYQPQYGGQPTQATTKHQYVFGIFPGQNPANMFAQYMPLIDLLNAKIPSAHFSLEASRNYPEFEKKLYARHFDLALPNPYQTINALEHGYRIFGKMADDDAFRGLILIRKDSNINKIADLQGKTVSFPAATALAATMLPQQYLYDHGLPITAYQPMYVGSQESSIMNAYLGNTAAGAAWQPSWFYFQQNHPEQAAQLAVKWQTQSLPNNSLMARDDFPPALLKQVTDILFTLQNNPEGKAILADMPLSHFTAATAQTYDRVKSFLAHFDKTVRHLQD